MKKQNNINAINSVVSTIAQNKKIFNKYFIEQEIEAGLLLQKWEIKSLRLGRININNGYIMMVKGEAYLFGAFFQPSGSVHLYTSCDPMRDRKLLLNKHELNALTGCVKYRGYTIVAMSLYWKNTWIKLKIGIARGKKEVDKRAVVKNREWNLDKARIIKYANRQHEYTRN